jgi:hypothetical protein
MNNQHKPFKPSLSQILKEAKENFSLVELNDSNYLNSGKWIEENFPIASWGRIKWSNVSECTCMSFSSDSEAKSLLDEIVSRYNLHGDVNISWTNALLMPIEIDILLASKYAEKIFEEDWDTWIYSKKYKWCIEVYHSGEICFGYSVTYKTTLS